MTQEKIENDIDLTSDAIAQEWEVNDHMPYIIEGGSVFASDKPLLVVSDDRAYHRHGQLDFDGERVYSNSYERKFIASFDDPALKEHFSFENASVNPDRSYHPFSNRLTDQRLYPDYNETVGSIYGVDRESYLQGAYGGYVQAANDHLSNLTDLSDTSKYPRFPSSNLYTAAADADRTLTHYHRALNVLKEIEPGMDQDMYDRRVLTDMGIDPDSSITQAVETGLTSVKTNFIERYNGYMGFVIEDALNGCKTSEEFDETRERLGDFLSRMDKRTNALDEAMDIVPSPSSLDTDMLDLIREKHESLSGFGHSGAMKGIRSLFGMDRSCEGEATMTDEQALLNSQEMKL